MPWKTKYEQKTTNTHYHYYCRNTITCLSPRQQSTPPCTIENCLFNLHAHTYNHKYLHWLDSSYINNSKQHNIHYTVYNISKTAGGKICTHFHKDVIHRGLVVSLKVQNRKRSFNRICGGAYLLHRFLPPDRITAWTYSYITLFI